MNEGMQPTNAQTANMNRLHGPSAESRTTATIPERQKEQSNAPAIGLNAAGRHAHLGGAHGGTAGTGAGGGVGTRALHTGGMAGDPSSAALETHRTPPPGAHTDFGVGANDAQHHQHHPHVHPRSQLPVQANTYGGQQYESDALGTGVGNGVGGAAIPSANTDSKASANGNGRGDVIGGRLQQAAGALLGSDNMKEKGRQREERGVEARDIARAYNPS